MPIKHTINNLTPDAQVPIQKPRACVPHLQVHPSYSNSPPKRTTQKNLKTGLKTMININTVREFSEENKTPE